MEVSHCGNFVAHEDWHILEVYDDTPEEFIKEIKDRASKYPFTHTPTVGEPYEVTHCTFDHRQVDYEDYYAIHEVSWRAITNEEREYIREAALERDRQNEYWEKKRFEKLKEKYGGQ